MLPSTIPFQNSCLTQRGLLGLQRTAGNAVVVRLMRTSTSKIPSIELKRSQTARYSVPSVQRLIVIGDPKADVGRFVAVHNIQARVPGHSIVYLKDADLAAMKPGEVLYISAHGSPDAVGHLDPDLLAQTLLTKGLKDGTFIDLKSCNTAVPSNSYVEKLERSILQRSGGTVWVNIQGYTGTHVITKEGASLTKDSSKNVGKAKDEYDDIIRAHSSTLQAAKLYVERAEKLGTPLEDIAKEVVARTAPLFDALYKHNPKVAKRSEEATGFSRVQDS